MQAWYAQQDAIEYKQLIAKTATTTDLLTLQSQIEVLLNQLAAVTQRIQHMATENQVLRQENTALQQQLILPRSA